MGKYTAIRISPCLISLTVRHRLRKHLSIIRQDLPAHDLLCKCLLSGIIRIIDKFLALKKLEVRKISHQTDKQCQKWICDHCKFPVFCILFSCLSRVLRPVVSRIRSFAVFFSHCFLPHPVLKYTVPELPQTASWLPVMNFLHSWLMAVSLQLTG